MSTTKGSFRFHLFRHVFQIGWDAVDKDGSKKRQKLSPGKKTLIRLLLRGMMG